ncbi:hypothetical protein [Stutzerimonas stutzeri]|uniref:hypothetical protein n=1 Tax=Stutzerimonas stutzeri TaxID=316 RepID=UPI001BCAADAB|nr:hypothetical protein [Stutzerimonas stutzeri]
MPKATAVVIAPNASDAFIAYQALRERCSVMLSPSVDLLPQFGDDKPEVLFVDARALSKADLQLLVDRVLSTGTQFYVGLSAEKPIFDLAITANLNFKTFLLPLTHSVASQCLEGIIPAGNGRADAQPANDENY